MQFNRKPTLVYEPSNLHGITVTEVNQDHSVATDHSTPVSLRKQRGFTLMEMMVAIALMAMFLAAFLGLYDGSSSKARRLFQDMTTIKSALLRANADMGGTPSNLTVLWTRNNATAANMYNGIAGTSTWSGPYMEAQTVDSTNAIKEPSINDQATISVGREAANSTTNGGNYRWVYYVRASNIPNAVIQKFIKDCAGSDDPATVTFVSSACRASMGTGATEFGTVDVKVSDTY